MCFFCSASRQFATQTNVHDYLELWNWDGTLERIHLATEMMRTDDSRSQRPADVL